MIRHTLLILLALALGCCGGFHDKGVKPMKIELDMFSGRPNPAWEPSAGEQAEITARLLNLPPSPPVMEPDGLGYRGFVILNPIQQKGMTTRIRIFNGKITIEEYNGSSESFHDAQNLETLLQQQASTHGFTEIIKSILPE